MPRGKPVTELTDMEIDEVSLVDRPANQHAEFAIAKRAEEDPVPTDQDTIEIFNEQGEQIDPADLSVGDVVYDASGAAFEAVELDADEIADLDADDAGDEELLADDDTEATVEKMAGVKNAASGFMSGLKGTQGPRSSAAGVKGQQVGAHVRRNKGKYAAGSGGAAVGAGGAYAMSKNFADDVREELSKAANDEERDAVIAKALDELAQAREAAAESAEIAKAERDLRLNREYAEVAEGYNLPVDPTELGPVLKRMAESLPDEDCAVIHKALTAAGTALYEEIGFIGGGDNVDVMSEVEAHVQKNEGEGATADEIAKFFAMNPDAYDEYLSEQG